MTSTANPQSRGSQEPSTVPGILTKEEKEMLLNKKMEELRRKNEALRKRHEEIEADKKAAHQMGRMVEPRLQVSSTPNKKVDAPREPRWDAHKNMKGVREDKGDDKRSGKLAAGRAKRLTNMSKEKLKAQFDPYTSPHGQQQQPQQQQQQQQPQQPPQQKQQQKQQQPPPEYEKGGGVPPGGGSPNQPQPGPGRWRGGSGRLGPSQQEPRSPESENGPPPDPAFNFLSDRSREGPLPERMREHKVTTRHPRNFGGTNFNDVQQKIKFVKDQGRQGNAPRSKMEMSMKMTGRERREYSEWKNERERIDQARIDRQLSNQGDWRREWDHDKVEQDFESDPSESGRRTEPGRRPAGRIGSGRFDRGDSLEERKRGDGPGITEQTLENLQTVADYERDSREERDSRGPRDQGGRGRGGRSRGRGIGRPHSGNFDRDRPMSGNYEHDRPISGTYDHDHPRSTNFDRDRPRSGNYERQMSRDRPVSGNFDHDRTRSGNFDHDRTRSGNFDHDRIRSGNFDHDRPRSGNYERQMSGGHYDRDRPASGNYERNNYDRHRASSTGSDETSRSVEEQNDSLMIKIDNEFASPNRRFKTSPSDDKPKRRSFDDDGGFNGNFHGRGGFNGNSSDHGGYNRGQENGEAQRGDRGAKRGMVRPERARRNIYRGGDDGVRADGYREPPRGRGGSSAVGRNRTRRAGSGRIPDDRHFIHDGDSNLAEVAPDIAMGTFDENWDYGDLQPGSVVQIVSADLAEKEDTIDVLSVGKEEGMKSPDDREEWEDAHDFYDIKMGDIKGDSDDEDDDHDPHNSSAESLERFIQEHTLKLDVNVESMVPPLSPLSDPASPESLITAKAPLTGAAKYMDLGASENFSDNNASNASESLNTSRNAEDMTDLPDEVMINEPFDKKDGTEAYPEVNASIPKENESRTDAPEYAPLPESDEELSAEGRISEETDKHVSNLDDKKEAAEATMPPTVAATSTTPSSDPAPGATHDDTEAKAENPLPEPTAEKLNSPSAGPASSQLSVVQQQQPQTETSQLRPAEPNEGIEKPKKGTDKPEGENEPKEGTVKSKKGVQKPKEGFNGLKEGIDKPNEKLEKLNEALETLKEGAEKPKEGIEKPKDSLNEVKETITVGKTLPVEVEKVSEVTKAAPEVEKDTKVETSSEEVTKQESVVAVESIVVSVATMKTEESLGQTDKSSAPAAPVVLEAPADSNKTDCKASKPQPDNQTSIGEAIPVHSPGATLEDVAAVAQG